MTRRYLDRVTLPEALQRIARIVACIPDTERVGIRDSLGRVVATSVHARRSAPHYPASAMDGLAVRSGDLAGASPSRPVFLTTPGASLRVDTGDPLPEPFDAVVKVEDLVLRPGGAEVRGPVVPWANVRQVGEDAVAGDPILPRGRVVTPWDLSLLATAGVREILARRRPRVIILPTGDEIIPWDADPGFGQIPETNSLMLAALVEEWGGVCQVHPPVPDDRDALRTALGQAATLGDAVVLNAGSAAGRDDICPALVGELGDLIFHGLMIMPGRPAFFGRIGSIPVLGLPGYPVSAFTIARLLLMPIMDALLGRPRSLPWTNLAVLDRPLPSRPGVREVVRTALGSIGGSVRAYPLPRGAGILSSLSAADGLIEVPEEREGIEGGASVTVLGLGRRIPPETTLVVIGSNDPSLASLEELVKEHDPDFRLLAIPTGSQGGLVALAQGRCHLAACHLLDPASGEYITPFCRRLLPAGSYRIITLGHRRQGIYVAAGNPLGIRDLSSLAGGTVRFVNRQAGSGTRILIDHLLAADAVDPGSIDGYGRELFTHPAVAAAVAGGTADAGPGVESVARAMGLSFVPLAEERFDLVVPEAFCSERPVVLLLNALRSERFREILSTLAGYRASETGREVAP